MASKLLRENKDERRVWDLAGAGWKKVLINNKNIILKSHVYGLNTPKTKNINTLFNSTVGFKNISKKWKIPKMNNDDICSKLDKLIILRGEIAHQVKASKSVNKNTVISHINFIERLSIILNNEVNDYIKGLTGKEPWGNYQFSRNKKTS